MESGHLYTLVFSIIFGIIAAWIAAVVVAKRQVRLGREERQELAAARSAFRSMEQDIKRYRQDSDPLADVLMDSINNYKRKELS